MLSGALASAVRDVYDRMGDDSRAAVRSCLRSGGEIEALTRFYHDGPLVLVVTVPEAWRAAGGCWANQRTTQCTIPRDREAATLAWAAARSPFRG